MQGAIKAVIFDMDGVLINSEHLWRRAMIKGFGEFGMPVTETECRQTMGMRIGEVIRVWQKHFNNTANPGEVEKGIMALLLEHIAEEGQAIGHIPEILDFCVKNRLRIGLATSSSHELMHAVLKKLNIAALFHACISAEHLAYGKPHPEVFLKCAAELNCKPGECIVIEDSLNGIIAAKAAQMQVIAVPDDEHASFRQFALADHRFDNMKDVLTLFQKLFSPVPESR